MRRRVIAIALMALVGLSGVPSSRGQNDDAAPPASRMWLELEPGRFAAQATVVDLLGLDGLEKHLQFPTDAGTRRRAALFSQQQQEWRRHIHVEAARPPEFRPEAFEQLVDLGGPGRLLWRAADPAQPATVLEIIGDLEQIWGGGMQEAVADYAAAFNMLGRFHAGLAEVREGQGRLTGRLVLLADSEASAKQASGALALASTLGRMVAAGAVRSGNMTAAEAAALDSVLGSITTRVDGSRLTVQLGIDVATLREVFP